MHSENIQETKGFGNDHFLGIDLDHKMPLEKQVDHHKPGFDVERLSCDEVKLISSRNPCGSKVFG